MIDIRYKILAAVMTLGIASANAAPVKITAAIDSTVIEMGSRAVISVIVSDPSRSGVVIDIPEPGEQAQEFDVVSVSADTVDAILKYDITLQAFEPGVLTFPPFHYVVGNDTSESDILTLKVLPVDLDSLTTINPMESVVNPPRKWYDFIPDWFVWVVLAALVIVLAGVAIYVYRQYRSTGQILFNKPKPVDPYERAISELNKLKQRRLAESGKEKEYYTALVDILRQYLQGRFNINAMEMSSTQILDSLRHNPETKDNRERIRQILEIADFVKFAKVRPLPDDNVKSYNNVVYFVESTKPVVESPEGEDAKDDKSTAK